MKRIICLLAISLISMSTVYADTTANVIPMAPPASSSSSSSISLASPPISWASKNDNDAVTINNGNGASLQIIIIVASGGAGVNVKNCGSTQHINAGSSAVCVSSDAANPVSFSSESQTQSASGTYQVQG